MNLEADYVNVLCLLDPLPLGFHVVLPTSDVTSLTISASFPLKHVVLGFGKALPQKGLAQASYPRHHHLLSVAR